jgi:hypothetical protein
LNGTNIAAARQWFYRRLRRLQKPVPIAIGTYEASLNRELNGESLWAGEIHAVIAGSSQQELRRSLRIENRYREHRPNGKPVMVKPVKRLGRNIAYSLKRFVEERRAYISDKTGRQGRRHLPPQQADWAEYDAWLLTLPLGARTIAFGCTRRGSTFYSANRYEADSAKPARSRM